MKKQIVLLAFGAMFATMASCTGVKKEVFKQTCMNEIDNQLGASLTPETKKIYNDYCNCSAEIAMEKLSNEELIKMDKNPNDPVINAKLLQIIKPCTDKLEQDMSAANAATQKPQ